jgi:stage IV sporulation protein FB
MRDPLSWSISLGRLFGINIRVHWLFPLVGLGVLLQTFKDTMPPGLWKDVFWLEIIAFFSVLLHEFGHCFAARWMDGEATDILMWPLGGLAHVDVPHTPRANLVTAVGGPFVNLVICLLSAAVLLFVLKDNEQTGFIPPLNPLPDHAPLRYNFEGKIELQSVDGKTVQTDAAPVLLTARIFWLNFFLLLLNVLLFGFPLDGGRIFQCVLWPYLGYRKATLTAVFAGFCVMLIVFVYGIFADAVLPLCLAVFIYFSCKQQWILVESGGEDSLLGYDFSQGYTSLERDEPPPEPKKKVSWWQRWQQRRAERRQQRATDQRESEERRMDELLQKVQAHGLSSLSEEEKRFLKRVSDRYRNRNS